MKLLLFLSTVFVLQVSPSLCDEKQTPSTVQRHVGIPSHDALREAIADAKAELTGDNDDPHSTEDGLAESGGLDPKKANREADCPDQGSVARAAVAGTQLISRGLQTGGAVRQTMNNSKT